MRIGLLIYGSLETLSGGYLYDRQLVDYLHSQGDQVTIVSLPWRTYFRHLGDNFSARFQAQLGQINIDVLLQDELNHPSLFRLNQRLKPMVGYPIVSIVHHLRSSELRPAWKNQLYGWVERGYLNSVDGFVLNSQTTRQVVQGLVGTEKPSVVAVPGGDRLRANFTEAQIVARAHQPGPLRIFFLGNLIPRKGLHNLLAALTNLPRHLWNLMVTGDLEADRNYTRAIYQQIAAEGLSEMVNFTGPLTEAELVQTLETQHVLAVPSSYEGYGIAYLEGMGFGLPAIATTAGAAWEIITPGVDGFLIEPQDVRRLAEILKQLAEDREILAELSRGASRRNLAQPTWEQTAARIRAFLLEFQ
jgi:glycosyltransferase involved in cell wall biosynthesis